MTAGAARTTCRRTARRRRRLLAWLLVAVAPAPLVAQADRDAANPPAVGPAPTYVLLTGLVGSVAGFERLQPLLRDAGSRVVVIDPYRLSIDSADVSFAALARRVDAVLRQHGIDSAHVVGHAHGAGVALRLAASHPQRVAALVLLDAGALASNRTRILSASLRFAPLVSRLPGGRGAVRGRIVRGLEQNAGRHEWLDERTRQRYTEPLLDHIDAVVRMAGRLAESPEPEPVSAVVARLQVPVTALLGAAPHPASPDSTELAAFDALGPRFRIVRLAGVGHFPHEEAPAEVAAHLLAPLPERPAARRPAP